MHFIIYERERQTGKVPPVFPKGLNLLHFLQMLIPCIQAQHEADACQNGKPLMPLHKA